MNGKSGVGSFRCRPFFVLSQFGRHRSDSCMIKALLKILCTCIAVVAIVIGATNALVVLTTEDDIVSVDEASGYQADAIVVLGASDDSAGPP